MVRRGFWFVPILLLGGEPHRRSFDVKKGASKELGKWAMGRDRVRCVRGDRPGARERIATIQCWPMLANAGQCWRGGTFQSQ
jgi:hypothetical protein